VKRFIATISLLVGLAMTALAQAEIRVKPGERQCLQPGRDDGLFDLRQSG